MEHILIAIIEKLEPIQLVWVLGFAVITLTYNNKIGNKIRIGVKTTTEIESKYKKELRNFIRAQIDEMIYGSTMIAKKIISEATEPKCAGVCGLEPLEIQFGAYKDRLELVARTYLIDTIFICIYENGFSHMTPEEREVYFIKTGTHLLHETQKQVFMFESRYPAIINDETERCSVETASEFYKNIVLKYESLNKHKEIELKANEDKSKLTKKVKAWIKQKLN